MGQESKALEVVAVFRLALLVNQLSATLNAKVCLKRGVARFP
jgi:hypothetical protein